MEEKGRFGKGFASGVLVTLLLAAAMFFASSLLKSGGAASEPSERVTGENVQSKLDLIQDLIDDIYLEDINSEELIESTYKGLVSGLGDPYSAYYTEEEFAAIMEQTEGSYSGIGAVLMQSAETGVSSVQKVYENAPAAEAGLRAKDIFYKIDDEDVTEMDLSTLVTKLKGKEGTKVKVTILRGDDAEEIEMEITRRKVEIPTISSKMLEDKIGYIEITEFDDITSKQYIENLAALEDQGMERLVIDLRDNPGGTVKSVCEMLDYMLPEGVVVYTEDKDGNRKDYTSDEKQQYNKPVVILVNENSASASEIFAGAMQDYGKAALVGTTTYGKGIVQEIKSLGDGSALKLTTSKYFTPNGRDIHEKGIAPDVEVDLPDELKREITVDYADDTQLQKAVEVVKER